MVAMVMAEVLNRARQLLPWAV
ncbi:hypothetical protein CCACVL1_18324 [Corchorus capsularis]|uniref:Uncharacterized protein n=1 Tax=Corchorus capsularis TaxID=210143 RepID=A0A1R3HLQ2_COCAP|nr:hypothetical protein CCACVL1_18324 [Corchorus capsularis]